MDEQSAKLGLTEEDVRAGVQGPGIAELLSSMGNAEADTEAIAASPDGKMIAERLSLMAMGEDSPEEKEYWLHYEKGLKKEIHGEGLNKWSSFIPVAADTDPDRKFPLIFCLHGAHNPIQLTESYGVMQVAAREECIVIAPENENLENILALLEEAKKRFPVDPTRVYSIGYSFGGFMSSRNVLARPDLFAGVGMGGMLFAGDVCAHDLDGQWYPEYTLTEEMLKKAEELKMPVLLFMGENEMLNLLPLTCEPVQDIQGGVIPLESKDKKQAFNNWRRVGGCKPTGFLDKTETDDPVEKSIGAKFERTEVREVAGRKYFIGDSISDDGECLFRAVACEKMVHWPTPYFAELVWEHIGKYAREEGSGKLIRLDRR